jgi:hypothetical protein
MLTFLLLFALLPFALVTGLFLICSIFRGLLG